MLKPENERETNPMPPSVALGSENALTIRFCETCVKIAETSKVQAIPVIPTIFLTVDAGYSRRLAARSEHGENLGEFAPLQAAKEFRLMSDVSPIVHGGHGTVGPINRIGGLAGSVNGVVPPAEAVNAPSSADRVELSDLARYLDRIRAMPEVRLNRIAQIRQALDNGTYKTDDKIDLAISRLEEEENL